MFENQSGGEMFRREVATEIQYLSNLHGADALKVAREKAGRPNQRTTRRKVLEATVRCLEQGLESPRVSVWDRLLGKG